MNESMAKTIVGDIKTRLEKEVSNLRQKQVGATATVSRDLGNQITGFLRSLDIIESYQHEVLDLLYPPVSISVNTMDYDHMDGHPMDFGDS